MQNALAKKRRPIARQKESFGPEKNDVRRVWLFVSFFFFVSSSYLVLLFVLFIWCTMSFSSEGAKQDVLIIFWSKGDEF